MFYLFFNVFLASLIYYSYLSTSRSAYGAIRVLSYMSGQYNLGLDDLQIFPEALSLAVLLLELLLVSALITKLYSSLLTNGEAFSFES